VTPGTAFFFKNYKHQFIYDPAVSYGNARNIIDNISGW